MKKYSLQNIIFAGVVIGVVIYNNVQTSRYFQYLTSLLYSESNILNIWQKFLVLISLKHKSIPEIN